MDVRLNEKSVVSRRTSGPAEAVFYRYKQLVGDRLRSRNNAAQVTEVGLAINVFNRMLELGAARSEPVRN